MINRSKKISIKFKRHQSVFEALNDVAYAVETRPLGTSKNAVSQMISHPTLCDVILPNLIGMNRNSQEWEREKTDYISNLLIRVPISGYRLNLQHSFDRNDMLKKDNIDKYIKDYKLYDPVKKEEEYSEEKLYGHIITNVAPIDLHMYFRFVDSKDYLFWVYATLSSQVANTAEDVEKSTNIRFFLFDEKIADKVEADLIGSKIKTVNKISGIKSGEDKTSIIDMALVLDLVEFEELLEMSDTDKIEYCFAKLYAMANEYPTQVMAIAEDKDIKLKGFVRKAISKNLISNEDGEFKLVASGKSIGNTMSTVLNWLKNPLNEGDVTNLKQSLKSK